MAESCRGQYALDLPPPGFGRFHLAGAYGKGGDVRGMGNCLRLEIYEVGGSGFVSKRTAGERGEGAGDSFGGDYALSAGNVPAGRRGAHLDREKTVHLRGANQMQ